MDLQRSGVFIKTYNNGFYITSLNITPLGYEVDEVGGRLPEPEVKIRQLKTIILATNSRYKICWLAYNASFQSNL